MDFDPSIHNNDDGSFSDQFHIDLPEILGDEFKGKDLSAMFKRAGNITKVIRDSVHTRQSLATIKENVIQKPAEKASDEDKANYKALLRTELGAPKTAEEYGFVKPTLPEGMVYDEALDKSFSELFLQLGLPVEAAAGIRNAWIKDRIGDYEAEVKAENEAFDKEVAEFTKLYPGDQTATQIRLAHDALLEIAGDDVKDNKGVLVTKGLKTLIKEAALYANPTDWPAWKKLGLNPTQLGMFAKWGQKMSGGTIIPGQGPGAGKADADADMINAMNAGSPGFQVEVAGAKT